MITLVVLLVGTFMASLDVAIVNVAAPAIQSDLDTSAAALQLIVAGYSVVYATLLIVGARLGADLGHRRLFLAGLAGFTMSSLACGLAWSAEALIAARLLQGASAAAMSPQVMSVIQLAFDGPARAVWSRGEAPVPWATRVLSSRLPGRPENAREETSHSQV